MTLDELKAELDRFSQTQIEFVATVVKSLSNPPRTDIREQGTWLTGSPEWVEYFSLALSVHHGATTEPLGLTAFETVFRNACKAANWILDPLGFAARRFVDLEVACGTGPARHLSLKSTAAGNLSETTARISKLTDVAWIQDVGTARDRRARLRKLVQDDQQAVDAIIMLRAFARKVLLIAISCSKSRPRCLTRCKMRPSRHSKGMLPPSIAKLKEKSLLLLPLTDPMRRLRSSVFGCQPAPYMPTGIERDQGVRKAFDMSDYRHRRVSISRRCAQEARIPRAALRRCRLLRVARSPGPGT